MKSIHSFLNEQLVKASNASGTSFYGYVVNSSAKKISELLGIDPEDGDDKTTFEWALTVKESGKYNGLVFTIYDYKHWGKLSDDDEIEFHIGAASEEDSKRASEYLKEKYGLDAYNRWK